MCSEIEHLSDQEQADEIAKHFCAVREKFEEVKPYEIKIPKFTNEEIPKFTEMEVASKLESIKFLFEQFKKKKNSPITLWISSKYFLEIC